MGHAALSTDTVGALTLTVEMGVRVDVLAPQVGLVGLRLGHTHPTANVDVATVTSSATPPAPFTRELAVPRMDGVATPLITVGLAAKADVMAEPVIVEAALGAALERPLQLQWHLARKNPCWARLLLHLRMAVILQTVPAALGMGIPFVVTGRTVLVALFTG